MALAERNELKKSELDEIVGNLEEEIQQTLSCLEDCKRMLAIW